MHIMAEVVQTEQVTDSTNERSNSLSLVLVLSIFHSNGLFSWGRDCVEWRTAVCCVSVASDVCSVCPGVALKDRGVPTLSLSPSSLPASMKAVMVRSRCESC